MRTRIYDLDLSYTALLCIDCRMLEDIKQENERLIMSNAYRT